MGWDSRIKELYWDGWREDSKIREALLEWVERGLQDKGDSTGMGRERLQDKGGYTMIGGGGGGGGAPR